MCNWEEDEIDLSQPSPRESHTLLSSLQHEEKAKNIVSELNRQVVKKHEQRIIEKVLWISRPNQYGKCD